MKSLSEKLKEIPSVHYTTQLLLQAWLREADTEVAVQFLAAHILEDIPCSTVKVAGWIRLNLLGTTRPEDGK